MYGCFQLNKLVRRYTRSIGFCLLVLPGLVISPIANSQTESSFDQWKNQYLDDYSDYKSEIDKEFSSFLKKKWKKFDTKKGIERDPTPKPVSIPRDKPVENKLKNPAIPDKIVNQKAPPKPELIKLPPPVKQAGKRYNLDYLGYKLSFFTDFNKNISFKGKITQKNIQENFDQLAKSDYESLVEDIANLRRELVLNDWAFSNLVTKLGRNLQPRDKNAGRLISWFLLLKSNVKSRLAYANNDLYLMVSTQQALYDVTYFNFDNDKFYIVSEYGKNLKKIYSYDGNYPKKLDKVDLTGINKIKIAHHLEHRKIDFKFSGNHYQLDVPFNRHAIEFFQAYPQMDIKHYFNVSITESTRRALLDQLRPVVEKMDELETVNFLLRMVQTGFDYKTDQVQFGNENYLFLEETIYYPSSDCEDRAIVFNWLVDHLTDLEVVGLSFPGHVASAVKLSKPVGDTINHKGSVYTITDPTYINATAGRKMPQFKTVNPKVIAYLK
jgi:hypothetical protein